MCERARKTQGECEEASVCARAWIDKMCVRERKVCTYLCVLETVRAYSLNYTQHTTSKGAVAWHKPHNSYLGLLRRCGLTESKEHPAHWWSRYHIDYMEHQCHQCAGDFLFSTVFHPCSNTFSMKSKAETGLLGLQRGYRAHAPEQRGHVELV